jgi:hypothetical protein
MQIKSVRSLFPIRSIVGGITVRQFTSSDRVRLVKELPELQLRPGEVGIVRGKWQHPTVAYEVEFQTNNSPLRLLLLENHLQAA